MRELARAGMGTLGAVLFIHVVFWIANAVGIVPEGHGTIRTSAHVVAVLLTLAWILAPSLLPAAYSVTLPVAAGVAQLMGIMKRGAILYGSLTVFGAIILVLATRYAVVRFRLAWEEVAWVLGGLTFGIFCFYAFGGLEASWTCAALALAVLGLYAFAQKPAPDAVSRE